MAGIWPLSFAQRHDLNGAPYPGALAHFYNAETDDPIDIYQDYSSAVAAGTEGKLSNPVEADGNGVFPGVYISGALSFYGFRMTTAAGVVLTPNSTIPNVGPSESEGEVVEPVSQTAIFKTGDLKHRYGEGAHDGWLPFNGRTFGSAISGADYVDDDNEALFLFLWAISSTPVVGGAGISAAADWAANKRYTLPNAKGRALVGLDDMDGSAAGVFPNLDVLGELLGGSVTLTAGQIPEITGTAAAAGGHYHFSFNTDSSDNGALNSSRYPAGAKGEVGAPSDNYVIRGTTTEPTVGRTSDEDDHEHAVTVGDSTPSAVSTFAPSMGVSIYIKK